MLKMFTIGRNACVHAFA